MTATILELETKLRSGEISPEQAVEQYEMHATFMKDITFRGVAEVLPSGFRSFDKYKLFKKDRSELVILGARPSMGKTALMCQLAANVAERGSNVLVFSMEMDKEALLERLTAIYSRKPIGGYTDYNSVAMQATRGKIDALPMAIDDRAGLHVNSIISAAKSFHKRYPVGLVVVDYLGLVKSREIGNINSEIGEVTKGLKGLAKDLKCPVLVASQLNRECERRGKSKSSDNGDFRPVLSDLRDSGHIEQDADVIVFLSRQEVYDGTRPGEADVRIAKNRNGEIGDFCLTWSGPQTRFYDKMEL